MRTSTIIIQFLVLLTVFSCQSNSSFDIENQDLYQGFQTPPNQAKPTVYYALLNGYVNTEFIDTELEEFARMGVGGLLVFDMGVLGVKENFPPAGPKFMSDEWLDNFSYIVKKGESLGMKVELAACSSWDMGGSWTQPEEAVLALYQNRFTVSGPSKLSKKMPYPELPHSAILDSVGKPVIADEVAVLAIPAAKRQPAHEFIYKLGYEYPHEIDHVVLTNCRNENPEIEKGEDIYAKDFSVSFSSSDCKDSDFTEVLSASLKANTESQKFNVSGEKAKYIRLRIYNGHHQSSDYIQLAEFEVIGKSGESLIHRPYNRRFDGGMEIRYNSQLGNEKNWTADNLNDGQLSGNAGSWISNGLPPALINDINSVLDISDKLNAQGVLEWDVPEGEWEIIRYFSTNTGETLKIPNPVSDGLATDHLSATATKNHINYLADRLEDKFGDLHETNISNFYLPSYEVRGMIWTHDMLELYREYRGYDLVKYLPALNGYVLGNDEITDRFLYDYQKTMGEILVDAFYKTASSTAKNRGMAIKAESAGPGPPIHLVPVEALKALDAVEEIQGEFWPWREHWDDLWVVKEIACAAHVYGKELVHMEAFTGFRHWMDGPVDLKPSADRAFCEGMNHVVWHMAEHNPPEAGKPGWVYHAGSHFNVNIVWWKQMKPWMDYLTRTSYLLQQGLFVGDVVYYYGDKGANFIPPKHTNTSLDFGYDYDVTNLEVMISRMQVKDNKLTLPDGMSYEILILPEQNDISLEALIRIEQLVNDGATVIGPKPLLSTGLHQYKENDAAVTRIADKLWGNIDGTNIKENAYGKGKIVYGKNANEVLSERNVSKDFQYSNPDANTDLDYIHRKTEREDIYFIRNKKDALSNFSATFRVKDKSPELWNPDNGKRRKQLVYAENEDGITFDITLDKNASVFVVFTSENNTDHIQSISGKNCLEKIEDNTITLSAFNNGDYEYKSPSGINETFTVKEIPSDDNIEGEWIISFLNKDMGTPDSIMTNELKSLSDFANENIKYYSGITQYKIDFEIDSDNINDEIRAYIDLGDLWLLANISLNGNYAGTLWKSPCQLEVTELLLPGKNTLSIDIANTWCNRLIGDARNPNDTPFCKTNIDGHETKEAVDWEDAPLRESGLFGPVKLTYSKQIQLQLK